MAREREREREGGLKRGKGRRGDLSVGGGKSFQRYDVTGAAELEI